MLSIITVILGKQPTLGRTLGAPRVDQGVQRGHEKLSVVQIQLQRFVWVRESELVIMWCTHIHKI